MQVQKLLNAINDFLTLEFSAKNDVLDIKFNICKYEFMEV